MEQDGNRPVTVVVATHKNYRMPMDKCYLPLFVGAASKGDAIGPEYERDDTGDNISELNPSFCELTGLYWAWKNVRADYIGLVHYRRHFSIDQAGKDPFAQILTEEQMQSLIREYEVVVPKKRRYYIESLYSHYKHTHYAGQLDETRSIIAQMYPDYLDDYDKVVKRTWGYMFNMMILRQDLLDEYCSWLFAILFELHDRVEAGRVKDCENLSAFQGRFYGRVSEIIFNAWLEHQIRTDHVRRIGEVTCISMEKIDWNRKIRSFFAAKFLGKKYEGSF